MTMFKCPLGIVLYSCSQSISLFSLLVRNLAHTFCHGSFESLLMVLVQWIKFMKYFPFKEKVAIDCSHQPSEKFYFLATNYLIVDSVATVVVVANFLLTVVTILIGQRMSLVTILWFSDSSWGHHLTPYLAANCEPLNQFLPWYWSFWFAMSLLPSLFSRQVVRHQISFGNLNSNREEEHMTKFLCHTLTSWVLKVVNLVTVLQRNKNKELKPVQQKIKKKGGLRRDEI